MPAAIDFMWNAVGKTSHETVILYTIKSIKFLVVVISSNSIIFSYKLK